MANPNPTKRAPYQSRAFFLAFQRCMEQRPLPGGQFQMPIVPAIVCIAFSIELGLKALALGEGRNLRGHKLADLFNQLAPARQANLVAAAGYIRGDFDSALLEATDVFVDWRYVHEQESSEANLGFLQALAGAVQKALPPD
jgi:hypothetical protein